MKENNQRIVHLAASRTPKVAPFRFRVLGEMFAESKDESVKVGLAGKVEYANQLCEIVAAIRLGDWLFCVEKMSYMKDYYIGAFFKSQHFTFGGILQEDSRTLQNQLMEFVASKILPILHPTLFESVPDQSSLHFFVQPLDEPYFE